MANIIQLDKHVSNLIAAGEVVERPASCVKELVENSIDAGADNVTIEIRSGGMSYIRVSDDGCGIASDDVETAFLRHATSKIRRKNDLEAITTLGFRGEALAAISAVSRVELLTKHRDEIEGRRVLVEAGTVISNEVVGCPDGTTMIIRDLFFNTPARLKFMKTDRAEGSAVTQTVFHIALSHPEVSIKYVREGETEFHTPGDSSVENAMYSVFGKEFVRGFLPVSLDDDLISVSGFISSPSYVKGNRTNQYFYVNGRFIKSKLLQAALEQSYKNTLFTGRYPACVLYISASPASVDVNVHPAKTEVKFSNEKAVFDAVYHACLGALEEKKVSPVLSEVKPSPKASASHSDNLFIPKPAKTGTLFSSTSLYSKSSPKPLEGAAFRTPYPSSKSEFKPGSSSRPDNIIKPVSVPNAEDSILEEQIISDMPKAAEYRIVGEVLDTYIVVERSESVWFIDKHAAHERIHFDRLKAQDRELMVQPLLLPIVISLPPEDITIITENKDTFSNLGFSADVFGSNCIAVRQIPSHISEKDVESVICDICNAIKDGCDSSLSTGYDEILHTIACKAAIKAGKSSDFKEIEDLVAKVMSGEVRFCPHGRPVAVEYDKNFFDKSFKRT